MRWVHIHGTTTTTSATWHWKDIVDSISLKESWPLARFWCKLPYFSGSFCIISSNNSITNLSLTWYARPSSSTNSENPHCHLLPFPCIFTEFLIVQMGQPASWLRQHSLFVERFCPRTTWHRCSSAYWKQRLGGTRCRSGGQIDPGRYLCTQNQQNSWSNTLRQCDYQLNTGSTYGCSVKQQEAQPAEVLQQSTPRQPPQLLVKVIVAGPIIQNTCLPSN